MPQGDYTTGSYEGQSRRVTQAKKYIVGRGYSGVCASSSEPLILTS